MLISQFHCFLHIYKMKNSKLKFKLIPVNINACLLYINSLYETDDQGIH